MLKLYNYWLNRIAYFDPLDPLSSPAPFTFAYNPCNSSVLFCRIYATLSNVLHCAIVFTGPLFLFVFFLLIDSGITLLAWLWAVAWYILILKWWIFRRNCKSMKNLDDYNICLGTTKRMLRKLPFFVFGNVIFIVTITVMLVLSTSNARKDIRLLNYPETIQNGSQKNAAPPGNQINNETKNGLNQISSVLLLGGVCFFADCIILYSAATIFVKIATSPLRIAYRKNIAPKTLVQDILCE